MTERGDIIRSQDYETADAPGETVRERLAWFQDMKFGLMLHWGPYSQWGCIESWPLVPEDTWARPDDLPAWTERGKDIARFQRDYWALNRTFYPTRFDPSAWVEVAAHAGMRYVCFTTKHHDGFCMFDTKTTDYRITAPECPFHRDPRANVTHQVFEAFRKKEFGISCYFSKSDWRHPDYWNPEVLAPTRNPNYDTHAQPARWERFVQFVHHQIDELMTGYGRIDLLWLDGGQVRPPDQDLRMAEIAERSRAAQPGLIMVDRTVGGPFEEVATPEQLIPERPLDRPWETCMTMGESWSYKPEDHYKPVRALLHLLIDVVAKGGNFLLNVGPDPTGALPHVAVTRLQAIGDWLSINGEAIYGARALAPYADGPFRYTQKDASVYVIVLAESAEARPPARLRLGTIRPLRGTPVYLLGHRTPLTWQLHDDTAVIEMPTDMLPCEHAWTLRLVPEVKGLAAVGMLPVKAGP